MSAYIEALTTAVLTAQSLLGLIVRETKLDSFYDKGGRPPMLENSINFSNVSFSYPKRNVQVLTGCHIKQLSYITVKLLFRVEFFHSQRPNSCHCGSKWEWKDHNCQVATKTL